jgi:hypothetical protein
MMMGILQLSSLADDLSSASHPRILIQNIAEKNNYINCMVIYSFGKYYGCIDQPPSMKPAAKIFL